MIADDFHAIYIQPNTDTTPVLLQLYNTTSSVTLFQNTLPQKKLQQTHSTMSPLNIAGKAF